jgi:glycosyltransferase involved in cell wall biosynthesis
MEERHLHIITHDVPWPADFGGVMDLFYKIKTLHRLGVKIHLHCFYFSRLPQEQLNQYCASVEYYKRNKNPWRLSFRLPFIVNSRKNDALIKRLQKDNYPVLIEGIHCSYPLHAGKLMNRRVLLRLHNTEFEYYHHLALHEKQPLKKFYFYYESKLLKSYEKQIAKKVAIAAVSATDVQIYQQLFNAPHIYHLPVFLPFTEAVGKSGKGMFCLYHGNLSINENEEAAIWLLKEVFQDLKIPFVIAGKNPSQKLEFLVHENQHSCLVANPSDKEMQDMIMKAQVNILPSLNNTGVKLKVLNALYNGRHCLTNKAGAAGSGLEQLCLIAETANEFKEALKFLYHEPYSDEENIHRNKLLHQLHHCEKNASNLIDFFWK